MGEDRLDPGGLEAAARAVCYGRSDEWRNPDDRQNALDDARAAITAYLAAVPADEGRLEALERVAEAAQRWDDLYAHPTPGSSTAWHQAQAALATAIAALATSPKALSDEREEG